MEPTTENKKEGCSCGKNNANNSVACLPGSRCLVFKKDVLVSECAGVKAVETKTKTKTWKATQRTGDVLKVLPEYHAVAEK